jgi:hypothetical protein
MTPPTRRVRVVALRTTRPLMAHGARLMMSKNERSTPKTASLAGKVLSGQVKPTSTQVKTLAASVLTQAPDKKKRK